MAHPRRTLLALSQLGAGLYLRPTMDGAGSCGGLDGTAKGTRMVHDLFPGQSPLQNDISVYAGFTGYAFMTVDGLRHGTGPGLWATDGTPANTFLVKSILAEKPCRRMETGSSSQVLSPPTARGLWTVTS